VPAWSEDIAMIAAIMADKLSLRTSAWRDVRAGELSVIDCSGLDGGKTCRIDCRRSDDVSGSPGIIDVSSASPFMVRKGAIETAEGGLRLTVGVS